MTPAQSDPQQREGDWLWDYGASEKAIFAAPTNVELQARLWGSFQRTPTSVLGPRGPFKGLGVLSKDPGALRGPFRGGPRSADVIAFYPEPVHPHKRLWSSTLELQKLPSLRQHFRHCHRLCLERIETIALRSTHLNGHWTLLWIDVAGILKAMWRG